MVEFDLICFSIWNHMCSVGSAKYIENADSSHLTHPTENSSNSKDSAASVKVFGSNSTNNSSNMDEISARSTSTTSMVCFQLCLRVLSCVHHSNALPHVLVFKLTHRFCRAIRKQILSVSISSTANMRSSRLNWRKWRSCRQMRKPRWSKQRRFPMRRYPTSVYKKVLAKAI